MVSYEFSSTRYTGYSNKKRKGPETISGPFIFNSTLSHLFRRIYPYPSCYDDFRNRSGPKRHKLRHLGHRYIPRGAHPLATPVKDHRAGERVLPSSLQPSLLQRKVPLRRLIRVV